MISTHSFARTFAFSLLLWVSGCVDTGDGESTAAAPDAQLAVAPVDQPAPETTAERPVDPTRRPPPTFGAKPDAPADTTGCTITYMGDYDWNPTWRIQETYMNYACSGNITSVTTQMAITNYPTTGGCCSAIVTGPSASSSITSGSAEFDISYATQPGTCWYGTGTVTFHFTAPGWVCPWYSFVCYWSDSVAQTATARATGPRVCL